MQGFWDLLVRPALEAADARTVVEVGSETGRHTRKLLAWCARRGGLLHVIDPEPAYEPEALAAEHPGHLVFHRRPSLEVLDGLHADAVLLDGDHNWYTVHHELLAIERTHGPRFPLVLLHDVAWPFARRDLYYAPERIPAEQRQPFAQGGTAPGEAKLRERGGLSPELRKAVEEGGPRNGVLTAVEDFLRTSALALRFERVEVDFGLGLLVSEERLRERPALADTLDAIATAPFQAKLALHAEARRIEDLLALHEERALLQEHARDVAARLEAHAAELRRHEVEVVRLRDMLRAGLEERDAQRAAAERHRAALEQQRTEVEGWRGHARGLEARVDELRGELARMRASRAWRLTAPLRRASAFARRIAGRTGGAP